MPFWRLEPELAHAVAGFGRIETLAPDEVFPSAPELITLEESAIAHLNDDHADAVQRYATRLGAADGDWKITAVDGDGAHLAAGGETLRMNFSTPVFSAEALRMAFASLGRDTINE